MTQHEMRKIAMQAIYLANQGKLTDAKAAKLDEIGYEAYLAK